MIRRDFLRTLTLWALATAVTPVRKTFAASGQDIVVIGAGMAGIAAAHRLKMAGCNVSILEARDRIGGRIWTDSSLGLPVDLGAGWIHKATGNPLTTLAESYGLQLVNTDAFREVAFDSRGKLIQKPDFKAARNLLYQIIRDGSNAAEDLNSDISLQTTFNQYYRRLSLSDRKRYGKLIKWLLRSEITEDLAADPKYISTWWRNEDEEFRGPDVMPPAGYSAILEGLLAQASLSVQTSHIVSHINYSGSKAEINTSAGTFQADRVLVTVPLGVLKANSISFSPALPSQKISSISRLGMGVMNKLVLQFPENFWNSAGKKPLGFIGNVRRSKGAKGEITEFFDLSGVTGEAILVAFVSGDIGEAQESLTQDERIEQSMKIIRRIYGTSAPDPLAALSTSWKSDIYARGSYSYMALGADPNDYDHLAESVSGKLFFAGEATSRTYPATVHGADLSGLRAADEILAD